MLPQETKRLKKENNLTQERKDGRMMLFTYKFQGERNGNLNLKHEVGQF